MLAHPFYLSFFSLFFISSIYQCGCLWDTNTCDSVHHTTFFLALPVFAVSRFLDLLMCITNKESFICGDKFSGFGKIVSNTKFLLIFTLGVNLTRFQQKLNQVELLLVSTIKEKKMKIMKIMDARLLTDRQNWLQTPFPGEINQTKATILLTETLKHV